MNNIFQKNRLLLVVPSVSIIVNDVSKKTEPQLLSSKPRIVHIKMVTPMMTHSKEEVCSLIRFLSLKVIHDEISAIYNDEYMHK